MFLSFPTDKKGEGQPVKSSGATEGGETVSTCLASYEKI